MSHTPIIPTELSPEKRRLRIVAILARAVRRRIQQLRCAATPLAASGTTPSSKAPIPVSISDR